MFERFTEPARRAISFALQEARGLGSARIDTVHLLLGVLREDSDVAAQVGRDALDTIRKELEQVAPPKAQRGSTREDLPLSEKSRRALLCAIEAASELENRQIQPPHLVLGLLRIEDCTAAKLLRAYGMDYDRYRETLRPDAMVEMRRLRPNDRAIDRPSPWNEAPSVPPAAASLAPKIQSLQNLLDSAVAHVEAYSESYGDQRLKRVHAGKAWMRKEALGHLIDWGMVHQQWLVQALTQPKVTAPGYPGEAEVASRHYADFSWQETVDLWVSLNRLLLHILMRVPEDRLDVPCRIGIADPKPLSELIAVYVERCEDIIGQILARL